ncbi:peptidase M14, partial [Rhizobium johnstonii]
AVFAWNFIFPCEHRPRLPGKLSVTVELRGKREVDQVLAKKDADGLWHFLAARGIVGDGKTAATVFSGPAVPLDNVEII